MELTFGELTFRLEYGKRAVLVLGDSESPIAECALAGQDKLSRDEKHVPTAEGEQLRFCGYELSDDTLTIVQESDLLRSEVVFRRYADCNTICVFQRIVNPSKETLCVSQVSALVLYGICNDSLHTLKNTYLYRFFNSWHCECQPRRTNLFEAGLYSTDHASFRRVYGSNKGGWSTKEELPQGIVRLGSDRYIMFAIDSPNDWYWEFGECEQGIYLYLGGADAYEHEWELWLEAGETYETPSVAVCHGGSLSDIAAQMTRYRRHTASTYPSDRTFPVVFNDYMHLSWDSPSEEQTRRMAPVAAAMGADIYVIDCGWHNEEDGSVIYPYVGQWKESKKRFPHGVKNTIDYIHSLGMKAGLWLEPEVVGQHCEEMIAFYPQDAWFSLDGKPVVVGGRRFLDYRCKAVRDYMDDVIDRIVHEYGADYIKFDYNQDCGSGTDARGDKPGRGLELASQAFFAWVKGVRRRYPELIIEGCASGGQRLDGATVSQYALVSSSDQTDYKKYPWIAANILSAVLPEQAGVWSYPVDSWIKGFAPTEAWVRRHVSDETVIMNMVNAMLGRMHLASHIELLSARQQALVREGIACLKRYASFKARAVPCFPRGFSRFGDRGAACGEIADGKMLLCVWNIGGRGTVEVDLSAYEPRQCSVVYPAVPATDLVLENGKLTVFLPRGYSARCLELELGK